MTEREQTLVFMANYIEDRELFDEPWRVVAVLDLHDKRFNEETPEEDIKDILQMITTDDYDDREVCYENEEEGISKTYKVCNSDDIDTMLENAKDDYLWEEKRTVPEHVRCYIDWDTMADDRFGSIYDLYDNSDVFEFYCSTGDYTSVELVIIDEEW